MSLHDHFYQTDKRYEDEGDAYERHQDWLDQVARELARDKRIDLVTATLYVEEHEEEFRDEY